MPGRCDTFNHYDYERTPQQVVKATYEGGAFVKAGLHFTLVAGGLGLELKCVEYIGDNGRGGGNKLTPPRLRALQRQLSLVTSTYFINFMKRLGSRNIVLQTKKPDEKRNSASELILDVEVGGTWKQYYTTHIDKNYPASSIMRDWGDNKFDSCIFYHKGNFYYLQPDHTIAKSSTFRFRFKNDWVLMDLLYLDTAKKSTGTTDDGESARIRRKELLAEQGAVFAPIV